MPSNVIRSFSYDRRREVLQIVFTSGRAYAYEGAPQELYEEMKLAFSKGAFFNSRIRHRYAAIPLGMGPATTSRPDSEGAGGANPPTYDRAERGQPR